MVSRMPSLVVNYLQPLCVFASLREPLSERSATLIFTQRREDPKLTLDELDRGPGQCVSGGNVLYDQRTSLRFSVAVAHVFAKLDGRWKIITVCVLECTEGAA